MSGDRDATAGSSSAEAGVDVPQVERVSGSGIAIRGNDIDTDQIIPARFMKVVTFEGLGQFAFFDQRFESAQATGEDETAVEPADEPLDHPMNDPAHREASIMVVNANFGCGSSREHAPQALTRWGIDAIVGESFAEIFAGNCLALGVPTVTADTGTVATIQEWVETNPDGELTVDVVSETVTYGDETVAVSVDAAQRTALLEGVWDTTALMRANAEALLETARSLPYVPESAIPDDRDRAH